MIKKEYNEKKICFDQSFNFYYKNRNNYEPKACHENSYIKFDDCNQKLIDANPRDFSFHTGLLCHKKLKICLVHSWVEYKGDIIDVTSIANSRFIYAEKIDSKLKHESKKYMTQNYSFINYSTMSNQELTILVNECNMKAKISNKKFNEIFGNAISNLADQVKKDEEYLLKINNKFGYTLAHDDFILEIK